MFYVYVIKNKKDNQFYVGSTSDLRKRLIEHNQGHVESTKERKPFDLIYYEASLSKYDAYRREKYLKTSYGKKYIKNRIRDYIDQNYSMGQG
jgi:putative endonuclease